MVTKAPSQKSAPKGSRVPLEVWKKAKERAYEGETLANISRMYGVNLWTLKSRANAEKWSTPGRRSREAENAPPQDAVFPAPQTEPELRNLASPKFSPDALLALAGESPEDFQRGLVKAAQVAIAQGIAEIESPKTVAELNTWVGIWRKAAGLDVKADSKVSTIISIGGGLAVRRSSVPIIDVTPDPLDDFLA